MALAKIIHSPGILDAEHSDLINHWKRTITTELGGFARIRKALKEVIELGATAKSKGVSEKWLEMLFESWAETKIEKPKMFSRPGTKEKAASSLKKAWAVQRRKRVF